MGSSRTTLRFCSVGGGKMGEAMIRGLLAARVYKPAQIRVVDPEPSRRERFETEYGIRTLERLPEAALYLLAVKPQDMNAVLADLKHQGPEDALVVSIAAGITTSFLLEGLGEHRKVVRAMPNAAAVVGQSATGVFFSTRVEPREREAVLKIFRAVGVTVVVDREDLMDGITAVSGSGPGYVFLLLEALIDAGVTVGLPREMASQLALQTFHGSAVMARETGKPFAELKGVIMSPGGTTAAGLKVLEERAVRGAILEAVESAARRAGELSR
jgi:pyrroline-5-carboxylate reductase